jgi:hypothetical protein
MGAADSGWLGFALLILSTWLAAAIRHWEGR